MEWGIMKINLISFAKDNQADKKIPVFAPKLKALLMNYMNLILPLFDVFLDFIKFNWIGFA